MPVSPLLDEFGEPLLDEFGEPLWDEFWEPAPVPVPRTPIVPGEFSLGVDAGPVWEWAVGPGASSAAPRPTRQLTEATGRVVTWRVAGHAFAQFSIDGRSDEAAAIVERRDDLWVHRDGDRVFRGRIVGAEDTIDGGHTTQFVAVDYRGLAGRAAKVEPPVPVFSSVDQAQIVWQLIAGWQALPGGDWGITEGVGAVSGTDRDETDIVPFSPVAEVIDRLLDRAGGGEWEISPDMQLNRWWPRRGAANGVVLDRVPGGGVLAKLAKSTPEFGNVAGATGTPETSAVVAAAADVAADERGRWTVAQGFPSVSRQSTVDDKAAWLLDQASTVEDTWRATFRAGVWGGRDHVWIGDVVTLRVRSGRLDVDGLHRVTDLQAVCGDDGNETITVGLVGVAA